MLASRAVPFLMMIQHGLANMQIRMPFQQAILMMDAGLPESALNLNCQKEEGAIQPRFKFGSINVFGCGLVLDPENKLWIFFTLNGQLLGELALEVLTFEN
jgi:hypothetical protein